MLEKESLPGKPEVLNNLLAGVILSSPSRVVNCNAGEFFLQLGNLSQHVVSADAVRLRDGRAPNKRS